MFYYLIIALVLFVGISRSNNEWSIATACAALFWPATLVLAVGYWLYTKATEKRADK